VLTLTNGTVAHEYQHLTNASRRMYVNGVGRRSRSPGSTRDSLTSPRSSTSSARRTGRREPTSTRRDSTIRSSRTPIPSFDQQFPPLQPVLGHDGDPVADRFQLS
jgi:hypothetical protein